MEFKELVSPSLTDLFVRELTDMILSGKLKIGERLPAERHMAEKMKVSLAVVNGGITKLTASGFLRVVPRKGVFVADYIRNGNIYTLKEILEYTGDDFDPDVLEPIYEFRRSIETAATRKACQNRTDKSLAILSDLLGQIRNAESNYDYQENAYEFHHEITVASGNIYYPMLIQTFKPFYILFYGMYPTITSLDTIVELLEKLFIAIQSQNEDAAENILNASMMAWKNSLMQQ